MGDLLYIIAENGEYVMYGKEIEVELKGNHNELLATYMFMRDKIENGKELVISRNGLHPWQEAQMQKDVSDEYLKYANEELGALGET